jgi:hypothetical protein
MRSREPVRLGMEMRSPMKAGVHEAASSKDLTVEPKSATPAKPVKNPMVAPKRPDAGLPRTV